MSWPSVKARSHLHDQMNGGEQVRLVCDQPDRTFMRSRAHLSDHEAICFREISAHFGELTRVYEFSLKKLYRGLFLSATGKYYVIKTIRRSVEEIYNGSRWRRRLQWRIGDEHGRHTPSPAKNCEKIEFIPRCLCNWCILISTWWVGPPHWKEKKQEKNINP